VQRVLQDVLDKSEVGGTAPNSYTVNDLQQGARSGDTRKWALMLSRDPGMSVYLLSTALVTFNRDEAFGWGQFYRDEWQNYSNALNDIIEAWGIAGTPGTVGSGGNFGPTEPPIELEVPDCPGVTRQINAYNIPPSIYPKPNCGGGTPGGGTTTGPTGVCTTDPNVTAYGPDNTAPPDGTIFWSIFGKTTGAITQGFGPTGSGIDYSNYDYTLGVSGHPGVDVDAEVGDELFTPVSGKVIADGGTGYFIHDPAGKFAPYTGELRIQLDNGDEDIIGHMSRIDDRKDDIVQAGQLVGRVEKSNGTHLHLEYRKKQDHANGTHLALDPRDVFGCADPNASNANQNTGGTGSNPDVQGVKTEAGDVLQATTTAPNFGQFQQKYGFPAPN